MFCKTKLMLKRQRATNFEVPLKKLRPPTSSIAFSLPFPCPPPFAPLGFVARKCNLLDVPRPYMGPMETLK
jgi:hypothetical protein